jgi:inorganic triphosphatase YgiF
MTEIELKFELAPKAHAAFRRLPALADSSGRTARLRATYFDTPDHELRRREMALRMRRAGGRWIQTLKAGRSGAGGLHARDEWEFERPDATLDLGLFADTPLGADPGLAGRLAEVFRVDVSRTTWDVEVSPGNRVEVALDRGEVRRGERAEPVSEVEIESVAGDPLAVFELAERLVEPVAMRPSAVTKAQRGYRLARGEPEQAEKARPAELDAAMSPGEAARAVARSALEQMQANEAGVIAARDPEFLHQYRVGLRRLRSALKTFRPALGADGAQMGEELRWIAALTGPARDWDVLVTSTLPALTEAHGEARAARLVLGRAAARMRAAHVQLREALESARYARLVLAVARWLAQPEPRPQAGAEPLADFALRVLRKRHKRLLADAKKLSALTPAERHALRLDAKRLRYALEGLAPLFRRARVEAYLEALSEIQDDLGRANDAAVAQRLLAELAPPAAFAQFARGWFAGQAQSSAAGLERHARNLRRAKRLRLRDSGSGTAPA